MSTLQYVGARYVPMLFNNGGSNNWIANYAYDALTIVTYNNTSYTSTKPVPASVGSPAVNPEYWVMTGNYNGFISDLQQSIDSILSTGAMQSLAKINGVLIGDSYTDLSIATVSWAPMLKSKIEQSGGKLDIISLGGSGFIQKGSMEMNFIDALNSITKKYNLVIVQGLVNDVIYNAIDTVVNAIDTFYNILKRKFPGVPMILFNMSKSFRTNEENLKCKQARRPVNDICLQDGILYAMYSPLYIYDSNLQFLADRVHPSVLGQNSLYRYALEYLLKNSNNIDRLNTYSNYKLRVGTTKSSISMDNILNIESEFIIPAENMPWLGGVEAEAYMTGIINRNSTYIPIMYQLAADGLKFIQTPQGDLTGAISHPYIEFNSLDFIG